MRPRRPTIRLQSVLNAFARLIYRKSQCEHVTPLLWQLYWLRSREAVDVKLAIFIFWCLHGLVPCCLADDIRCVKYTSRRRHQLPTPVLFIVGSTDFQTNATGNHGRPCLIGRRQSTLEHSAARRHLCFYTACFLQSFKVTFVQILFSSQLMSCFLIFLYQVSTVV